MAIRIGDTIEQSNRENTIGTSDYFYVVDGSDVNFAVEKILENSGETVSAVVNNKYVVRNASSSPISPPSLSDNDIVRYNGTGWEVFKKVSNAETNFGIIYDKRTQLFYQYDSSNGWKSLLRSGKIDGGTFS
jgi:hypothetical protein